jgi:penicillin-binding protein 1C
LNVPAILALERVGVGAAVGTLESCGISLTAEAAESAGLSLAVGGAEVRLVDLGEAWATLGRGGRQMDRRLFEDEPVDPRPALRADTSARIVDILSSDHRTPAGWIPGSARAPHISWKTGTSAGFRDAWAVGISDGYAIGVWIGRADGSGDPAYLGGRAAEPLLTRIAFELAELNP